MLLSQLTEERPDLMALVSSMPCLRHILDVGLRKAIVAVVTQKASKGDSITKLNSRLELLRSLVD